MSFIIKVITTNAYIYAGANKYFFEQTYERSNATKFNSFLDASCHLNNWNKADDYRKLHKYQIEDY